MIKLKAKRILSGFLVALMLLTSQNFNFGNNYAYAAEVDDFTIADGTLTAYNGSDVEISIPETINGAQVRAIADGVFEDKGLTKVVLPDSLERIGNRAFANNKIKAIYIPDSVTHIGREAFLNADNNKWNSSLRVTGMKGITSLEESSFAGMKDLEMEIPEVENLAKSAFMPQYSGGYGAKANYAKLYTEDYRNKHNLESEEGVYLIDPAIVRSVIMDANTQIPLKVPQEHYGRKVFDQRVDKHKDDFYKINDSEDTELKVANESIFGYLTPKEGKAIGQIETPVHDVEFYFEPFTLSAPEQVTADATTIEGITYPEATVVLEATTNGYSFQKVSETQADASGQYTLTELTSDAFNGKPVKRYRLQASFSDEEKAGLSPFIFTAVGDSNKAGIKEIIQPEAITVKRGAVIKTAGKDSDLPQTVKAKLTDDSEVEVTVSYWTANNVDTTKVGVYSYAGSLEYNKYYNDYDAETKVYLKVIVEEDETYYDTDNEALISAISYAKSKLNSVPVSTDGSEIDENVKWATEEAHKKLEDEITKAEAKKNSHRYNQNQINELTKKLYEFVDEFEKNLRLGLKEVAQGVEVKLLVSLKDEAEEGLDEVEVYLEDYANKLVKVHNSKKERKDKAIEFTFTGVEPSTYVIKANDPYICLNAAGQRKREYLFIGKAGIDPQKIEVEKGFKLTYENGAHGNIIGTKVFYLLKGEHFEDFRPSEVRADEGWFFKGWSLDGVTEIDLHKDIEADTVLTALYSEESHGLINENTEVGNGWYMKHFEFDEDVYGNVQLKGFSELGKDRNKKFYNVTLPSVNYEGQPVTVVAPEAFDHTKGITVTNVEIPEGYESIYSHAFYENEIVTVTFPKSMRLIGASAFLRNKIKEVHLNEGLEEIIDGAFAENEIYAVSIPASVTRIKATAFADNKLDEVIFDFENGMLQEIGKRAFYNNQLQYVIIPQTVKKLEFDVFERNTGLTQYGGKVGVVINDGTTNPHNLVTTTYHVINPQINTDEATKTEKLNLYDAVIKLLLKRNTLFTSDDGASVPVDEKYISFEAMKTVEEAIYAGLYAFYDTSTGAVPILYALGNEERYSIDYANEMIAQANRICDLAKNGEGKLTAKNRVNLQLGIPFIETRGDIRDHHEYVLVDKDNPNSRKYRFGNIVDVVPNTAWFNYYVPTGNYILEAPIGMVFTKAVDQGGKLVEVKDLLEITAPQENDPTNGGLDTAAAQAGAIIIYDLMNTRGSQDKGTTADKLYETVPKNTPAQNSPRVRSVEEGKKFAGWSFDGKTVIDLTDLKIKSNTILKAVYIDGDESAVPSLDYRKISEKITVAKDLIQSVFVSVDGSDVKATDIWVSKEVKREFEEFLQSIEAQKEAATSQEDLDNLTRQLDEKTKAFKNMANKGTNQSDKTELEKKYKKAQDLLEQTQISTKEDAQKLKEGQYWVTEEEHNAFYRCLVEANWVLLDSRASSEMVERISQKLDLEVEQFKKVRKLVKKEEIVEPVLDYGKISEKIATAKDLIQSVLVSVDGSDVKVSDIWVSKEVKREFEEFLQSIEAQKEAVTSQEALDNLTRQLDEKTKAFKNAANKGTKQSDKTELEKKYKKAQDLLEQTQISTKEDAQKLKEGQYWVTEEEHHAFDRSLAEAKQVLLDTSASSEMVERISQKLGLEVEQFKKIRKLVKKAKPSVPSSGGGGGGGGMITVPSTEPKKADAHVDKVRELDVADLMTGAEASKKVAEFKDSDRLLWSRDATIKVVQKGIMRGDSNGYFMPKKKVTRAEVAQVIANILGEKESLIKASDVNQTKWYAKAVQTVLAHDIFKLDSKGRFRPEDSITRAELFTVIARLKEIKALDSQKAQEVLSRYTDGNAVPVWAKGHVSALVEKGLVKGSNHKLKTKDFLTREEMAVLFAAVVK